MEKTVLIRTDASSRIGLGHLVRCLTIADYLRKKNIEAVFVSKYRFVEKYTAVKGFKLRTIESDCAVEAELETISNLASEVNANIAILDINNYVTFREHDEYCRYLDGIRNLSLFSISFEDYKIHPSIPDIVVIPYVEAEKINLSNSTKSSYLLGPKYFVLGDYFLTVRPVRLRKECRNILVSMGGGDTQGLTLKVLSALNDAAIDLDLKVVIGGFAKIDDGVLKKTLSFYKGPYSIIRDTANMAQIMSSMDLAIINSGLTKYEAAFVGLPCVVISNNEYHAKLMNYFAEYGSAIHLGEVNKLKKNQISEAVTYLADDYQKRTKMSEAGRSLVDGKGVARLFKETSQRLFYEQNFG